MAAPPVLALLLAAPPLLYPVEAPPQVTATVGTYRIGHHHAGLDLGTDGREGMRARAALDGEIVRIQRSHVGYGRAVYIRHADGLTTVYGHLERFSPALEAIARAEEARVKKYALEKTLDPPMPVKQGDFLGYVGTSGTDLIHLHFEVRSDNVPVNPLTHGLTLPDTQAPVISRVLLLPRDAGAQIDGVHAPRELTLSGDAAPPRLTVSGRVGVLVEVTDHIDGSPRDLEPAQLEFGVDGTVRHRVSYERVSYGQKNATELDYLAERKADGTGRFHRLWREGPDLLVFPGPVGRDLGDLSAGEHRLRFAAQDAAGHETQRELLVESVPYRAPCAPAPSAEVVATAVEIPLAGTRWTESALVVPLPGACAADFAWRLSATSAGAAVTPPTRFTAVPEGPALAIDLDPERDTSLVLETRGGGAAPTRARFEARSLRGGETLTALDGRVRLSVGKDALFAPYLTDVSEADDPGNAELRPVGKMVVFRQTWRPVRGGSTLRLGRPADAPTKGLGVYFREGDRIWRVGGRPVDDPPALEGGLVHVGPVGLMRDETPPTIGAAAWAAHPAGARLVVPVTDAGAGVDADSLRVEVDGKPVWPEFFHAYGRAAWRPWEPLKAGPHEVTLRVKDAAGNEARRTQRFKVGP